MDCGNVYPVTTERGNSKGVNMVNTNLLTERKKLGITSDEAACRLGVHPNTYSNWERGEATPTGDNLIKLVHLYGGTPEYLLGLTDQRDGRVIAST